MSLYAVETCELLRSLRPQASPPSPVCSLSWVQGVPPPPALSTPALHLAYRHRHTRFFPVSPPLGTGREGVPPGDASKRPAGPTLGGAAGVVAALPTLSYDWPALPDSLDMLVTCTQSGHVALAACGESTVAVLKPEWMAAAAHAASGGPTSSQQLQAALSRDFDRLVVLREAPPAPAGTGEVASTSAAAGFCAGSGADGSSSSGLSGVELAVFSGGRLAGGAGDLLDLSLSGALLERRLEVARGSLAAAARSWRGAAAELGRRFDEQLREVGRN